MNRTIESGSRLGDRMPWRRSRFARALVFLLTQALVLQPAVQRQAAAAAIATAIDLSFTKRTSFVDYQS